MGKSRALLLCVTLSACSPALTDDAVILMESEADWELADGSLENFRPHIGVKVTVTNDSKVFHAWNTEEKWRVVTTEGGESIDGATLCTKGQQVHGVMAVTERSAKTVWVGPCVVTRDSFRLFILAHEIGHVVGASDCEAGVMKADQPITIELSKSTEQELRDLYGK